mmetsp:Transcript_75434/g.244088  ORF Transcript_75434/g.244088 Transcript_75434/m.244088 type:complete len:222 (-) Transcript_75434:292-957(-)
MTNIMAWSGFEKFRSPRSHLRMAQIASVPRRLMIRQMKAVAARNTLPVFSQRSTSMKGAHMNMWLIMFSLVSSTEASMTAVGVPRATRRPPCFRSRGTSALPTAFVHGCLMRSTEALPSSDRKRLARSEGKYGLKPCHSMSSALGHGPWAFRSRRTWSISPCTWMKLCELRSRSPVSLHMTTLSKLLLEPPSLNSCLSVSCTNLSLVCRDGTSRCLLLMLL